MCYGVTANEMGYTESVNKASSEEQGKIFKRKAIKPLINVLQYSLNTQLLPEFFMDGEGTLTDECPLEFVFNMHDTEETKLELDMYEQQIRMGIMTPEMVAKELGIDLVELSPHYDKSGTSTLVACKVLRELTLSVI